MRKLFVVIFTILSIAFVQAAQNGIELKITISGKILIGFNHRVRLSDQHCLRYGVNMGYNGPPVGINLGIIQEFSRNEPWKPYAGISFDALLPKMNGKRTIVPFLKGIGGFAYSPQNNIAHQSELWLAFFWRSRTFQPIGVSLVHFNSVLD